MPRFSRYGGLPSPVTRYLLPGETHIIISHQHPSVLIRRGLLVLAGLAIAGFLSSSLAHGNNSAILVIWILFVIVPLLWFGWQVWDWIVHYLVLTSHRLLLVQGIVLRKVNFVPLGQITDVEFRRSWTGRLLGYGELEVQTAGRPDPDLARIRFIRYPEQFYLEVSGLMFKDTGAQCPECAMNIPTAARRCPHCTQPIRPS